MPLNLLVEHLRESGVLRSAKVIDILRTVDRSKYVPPGLPPYFDSPQPIGDGQTISAPHMHAQALELLQGFLHEGSRALDVGCGSGFLTACMGRLVAPSGKVVGIENRETLVDLSSHNVRTADSDLLSNGVVEFRLGNGWTGEGFLSQDKMEEVFDAIHVGAAAESMPQTLVRALKRPGRMVIPVGPQWGSQIFTIVDKDKDGAVSERELMSVMYVPLEQQLRPRGY